ncbi:MAG TPA: nitrogenase component 1 [Clostridia bacterium]
MSDRFIERPRSFCALGGAMQTVVAIKGAVPILHTAMGCGGSIYWNQVGSTGYLGAGYCGGMAVPSSNVQEKDIVFGGTERLTEQIENTLKLVEGDLYIVLTGCMTDIIGDDIKSVVRQFKAKDASIIGAETGGFKGDGYKGYDLVLQALFSDYVEKTEKKVKNKVNLWGIVPAQDAFWRGNINNIKKLLEKLGLSVNAFFTETDSLEGIKHAAEAELNIVVSEFYGIGAAKVFEDVHGVPYVTSALPIGPGATEEFIRKVAKKLGINKETVDKTIDEEKKLYFRYIDRIADAYNDLDFQRYAVVVGDYNYAPALTRFLADDLGWLPEITVVTDFHNDEGYNEINKYLENLSSGYKTHVVFETDASEIQYHLSKHWPQYKGQNFYDSFSPAYVVGSHLEREFAKKIGAAHLTVTYPVGNRVVLGRGYTGYEGSLCLIEDLLSVLVAER